MADQNELLAIVNDLGSHGATPDQIDAVVKQYYSNAGPQTQDTRPGGGIGTPHANVADPNRKPARAEDHYTPNVFQQRPEASVVPGVIGAAKGLGNLALGAVQGAFTNPMEMMQQDAAQRFLLEQKANAASGVESAGYRAASYIPLLGPLAAGAAEKIGTGDPQQMGEGLVEGGAMAFPRAAGNLADATIGRGVRAVPGVVSSARKNPIVRTAANAALDMVPGSAARATRQLATALEKPKSEPTKPSAPPPPPVRYRAESAGLDVAPPPLRWPTQAETPAAPAPPPVTFRTATEPTKPSAPPPPLRWPQGEPARPDVPPPPVTFREPPAEPVRPDVAPPPVRYRKQAPEGPAKPKVKPPPVKWQNPMEEQVAAREGGAGPNQGAAETQPSGVAPSKSRTSATFTENDLQAAHDKFGPGTLSELRAKHGEATVNDFITAERKARAAAKYEAAKAAKAAREAANKK